MTSPSLRFQSWEEKSFSLMRELALQLYVEFMIVSWLVFTLALPSRRVQVLSFSRANDCNCFPIKIPSIFFQFIAASLLFFNNPPQQMIKTAERLRHTLMSGQRLFLSPIRILAFIVSSSCVDVWALNANYSAAKIKNSELFQPRNIVLCDAVASERVRKLETKVGCQL